MHVNVIYGIGVYMGPMINYEPIFMKFGTDNYFGTRTKLIDIDYDRSIISPGPHTNVLPE